MILIQEFCSRMLANGRIVGGRVEKQTMKSVWSRELQSIFTVNQEELSILKEIERKETASF